LLRESSHILRKGRRKQENDQVIGVGHYRGRMFGMRRKPKFEEKEEKGGGKKGKGGKRAALFHRRSWASYMFVPNILGGRGLKALQKGKRKRKTEFAWEWSGGGR